MAECHHAFPLGAFNVTGIQSVVDKYNSSGALPMRVCWLQHVQVWELLEQLEAVWSRPQLSWQLRPPLHNWLRRCPGHANLV